MGDVKDPEETSNKVAWLKGLYDLPIPAYFATAVVLGSVLFAPDPYAKGLGFSALLDQAGLLWGVTLRPFVGFVLVTSLIFGLTRVGVLSYEGVRKRYVDSKESDRRRKRLHALTSDEKEVLRKFINERSRVAHFHIDDGVVNVLIRETILGVAAHKHHHPWCWPYYIQPWAWDYLLENPALLEPDEAERAKAAGRS